MSERRKQTRVVPGQKVVRISLKHCKPGITVDLTPIEGTVVYVHPLERFHIVEFRNEYGVRWYESFMGAADRGVETM